MPQVYVALDLETTGLSPEHDAIMEIGAVRFRPDRVLDTYTTLIDPRRPIPLKVQHLTGISQADVAGAPSLQQVLPVLRRFVGDSAVVGHNVSFDLAFLNRYGALGQNPAIDTFELASILLPQAPRYSLGSLADYLGISLPVRHRALEDATATKDLFLALLERGLEMDLEVLQEINRLAARSQWVLRFLFRELERARAQVASEGSIRAQLLEKGRLDRAAMGLVMARRPRDEPLRPAANLTPVNEDELAAMLAPGGLLARAFPGYEHRPQQVEMLRAVCRCLNLGGQLMVEAGTGTGKSLAYLLPAADYAVRNSRHVVISTNTINLQDQLYLKDIPDLQRLLPRPFRATLLKGRGNYLCLRRLAQFRKSERLSADQVRVLAKILAWLPVTNTGDQAELMLRNNQEMEVWAQIGAEADNCLGERCPHRRGGTCFLARARARAEAAHIIVVNHALLLSDVAMDGRLLPEFRHLIVDEAHHLEERATESLGFAVGKRGFDQLLSALSLRLSGDRRGGLLADIEGALRRSQASPNDRMNLEELLASAHEAVDRLRSAAVLFFDALEAFAHDQMPASAESEYDMALRLTPGLRGQPTWSAVEMRWDDAARVLKKLLADLRRLAGRWADLAKANVPDYDEVSQNLATRIQRASETLQQLEAIVIKPEPSRIHWLTINARDGTVLLQAAPLEVGPLLKEGLFDRLETAVLTSATLRIGERFDYIRSRLGLEWAEELSVGSPFNYGSSTLVYLPSDIPEPGAAYYQRAVEQGLIDLCRATKGRTLVLFTSHTHLRTTHRAISPPLEQDGIAVYGQGLDGSRQQLLDSFRNTPRAVLLGTRSFWEGIDVVGEALSCLVIARLPFSVPTDPITAARAETFDEPFGQYQVPEAVLRFRQGFGRLIRSREDRGVVVVLDRRLQTKNYGQTFLQSLPECTVRRGPLRDLPAEAARWIDGEAPLQGEMAL
ncbi:MAG: helicase C-terminal domain-containing protein [Anaerolineae bacterium]